MTLFILRDCTPVGVFIAVEASEGVLRVVLDYVIPGYRDLKVRRYLFFDQAEFVRARGIREIMVMSRTKEFASYLVKVGFENGQEAGAFRITYQDAPRRLSVTPVGVDVSRGGEAAAPCDQPESVISVW